MKSSVTIMQLLQNHADPASEKKKKKPVLKLLPQMAKHSLIITDSHDSSWMQVRLE